MDGSSNENGFGAGLILINPEEYRVHCALRFGFKASNNKAEYEALIAGLQLAKEMQVESLDIYSDSQLVVCQITNEYQACGEKMAAYLQKAKDLLNTLSSFKIQQIPREQNVQGDALARLASTKDSKLMKVIPVEFLREPGILEANPQATIHCVTSVNTWMTPIARYLKDGYLPGDKKQARLLKLKAARYALYDGQLYKRGLSTSLLKCVDLT